MRQFLMAIFATMLPLAAAWADNVAKIGETEYETLAEAFAAAQDGQTITLLADCSGNGIKAPQGKFANGLTVDFDNHTYTVDGATVGSTGTETNGFQLLKDNTITFKNGTITSAKAKILIQNYSNLTLEGMTLTMTNSSYASAYTLSNNNGNIAIDGTTITANTGGGFAFDVCRYSTYPSVNVEVKGASVINGNVEISASGSDAKDGFSLKLTSGELTGNIVVAASAAAAMEATPEKATVTKSENFSQEAPEGYKWQSDGNGTSTLVACEYVAQIGTVKYETLAEAFAAAKDGETIALLADCSGNGIKASQGKYSTGLTVDFNGHTYTVDGATVGSTGTETNGFQLLKDNTITFKNGTITSAKAKILIQNYSNLTLEGMTLTMTNSSYASAYTLSNNNGNIAIDGTTINANPAGGFAFDVCRYASYPSVNVEVKGESVINGNVEISASGSDAKDGFSLKLTSGELKGNIVIDPSAATAMAATPEKATVTKSENFSQNAPEGYKWQSDGNGNSTLVACEYVAQIGTVKYETLAEAFAAAQDGQTITLLADCSGNGIKAPQGKFANGLTVDFDNHTYTVDGATVGSTGTETNGFQLLKDNTITFKNGTITSAKAKILIQNYSNLTLEGMTLTMTNSSYASAYTLSNNNGNIAIDGTTITANTGGGFAFDVCRYASYPSVNVEVKGASVINGNVEISASGSDAKDGFSLKLTSGELKGNIVVDPSAAAAMEATPEKATVTKSDSFTQNAPEGYKWQSNEDGTSTLVACEYVAQIGTVKYETLAEAFAAAQDGETVCLIADVDMSTTSLVIDKAMTIDGANHTITSSAAQAVLLSGTGAVNFKDVSVVSSKGHGIQAGDDNNSYAGQLTLSGTTLTVAKRGIRVYSENTGFGIAVNGSVIQSNVSDPTTAYTVGNDAMALSLGAADGKGYTVTIVNSELKGFSYVINSTSSGSNLNVTMTGGKTYGRAALNVWGSNNVFTLDGVEVHGLNNQTGPSEAFACIVENQGATNNTYNINGLTFVATLSDAAMNTEGSSATQQMVDLRGSGATMKIMGNTTYTCNSVERGGLFANEAALETNTVLMDATAKANLASLIKKADVSETADENGLFGITYIAEVYYYWIANGVEEGGNYDFADPFVKGWLADGEFLRLKKNITLADNIACQLTSGSFTLTQGEYTITKGDFSVKLNEGVSVVTDKQTDIFAPAAEGFKIVETATDNGYTYTVAELQTTDMDIVLKDGEAYTITTDTQVGSATYMRTVKDTQVGKYQPWFVPFDYTITEEDLAKFSFYKLNMVANAEKAGEATDTEDVWLFVTTLKAGDMLHANKPYVFKPKTTVADYEFTSQGATLKARANGAVLDMSTSEATYTFYGNYEPTTLTPSDSYRDYYMSGGELSYPVSKNISLGSYRWYLRMVGKSGDSYARGIGFIEEDGKDATGLAEIKAGEESATYYTLDGIQVQAPAKGIYIKRFANGVTKKVSFK